MTVVFTDGAAGTITGREMLRESAYLPYDREYAVIEVARKYQKPRTLRIPVDCIGGLRGGERISDFTPAGYWTGVFGKGAA